MRSCRWLFVLAIAGFGALFRVVLKLRRFENRGSERNRNSGRQALNEGTVNFSSSSTGDAAIAQLKEKQNFCSETVFCQEPIA